MYLCGSLQLPAKWSEPMLFLRFMNQYPCLCVFDISTHWQTVCEYLHFEYRIRKAFIVRCVTSVRAQIVFHLHGIIQFEFSFVFNDPFLTFSFLIGPDENVKWIAIVICFQWNHVIYHRQQAVVVCLQRMQQPKSKSAHRPPHRRPCRIRRHQHRPLRLPFRQLSAEAQPAHIITEIINRSLAFHVLRPRRDIRPPCTSMSAAPFTRAHWKP